ncbi:MAG TPA: DUF1761 domain-containing protein [Candidatus Paceibacterota bacterium]|jgi:hypothetical protein|nr:DUF1761 domain-containing protein [Candidatus Paceibacterota bacterium]
MTGINFLAVLIAAVASMIVGSIWYGPLFGKRYIREMGWENHTPEERERMKKSMTKSYVIQFVASFVMFFVLDWYINTGINTGLTAGIGNAFGAWIGFIVPIKLGDVLWGGKKSLFWLSIGNTLVTLLVGGAILSFFA